MSDHAKLRWVERAGSFRKSVYQAWEEGYYVGLPTHSGTARLHPPTQTLILARGSNLITVLSAKTEEYRADHLIRCEECSCQFKPNSENRNCPWCDRCQINSYD